MESNKDEALRCLVIAKEAISAGNKQKALKFLGIARRLNHALSVDDLFAACEDLKRPSSSNSYNNGEINGVRNEAAGVKVDEVRNGERAYTEENVQLIKQIKIKKDYYSILGVEKTCSGEEIKRAYRKWSLKVHPDKNKAPGSEEAFKKVSKAFKCLSDDNSRRQYDQTGLVDEFENNQQHNNVRRRRRTGNGFYEDEFDADEIFRAFFGQNDMFRSSSHVYRTRAAGGQQREGGAGNWPNLMIILQLLPFLLLMLLAYLPFSGPEYSLQRDYTYQVRKTTEMYDVEYFVKSADFDEHYPHGSPERESIEHNVIREYKNRLGRYCHVELQRRQWNRHYPTPHCERLNEFRVA